MCKEAIVHWRFNKIILKMKKKKRENKEKVEEGEAAWDRPTEPYSWEREVMRVRIQWGPRAVWPQVLIPQP